MKIKLLRNLRSDLVSASTNSINPKGFNGKKGEVIEVSSMKCFDAPFFRYTFQLKDGKTTINSFRKGVDFIDFTGFSLAKFKKLETGDWVFFTFLGSYSFGKIVRHGDIVEAMDSQGFYTKLDPHMVVFSPRKIKAIKPLIEARIQGKIDKMQEFKNALVEQ
jgi:hypothetical protein